MTTANGPVPSIAIDNDVILKAACYRMASAFWPNSWRTVPVGILGAARYVVRRRIERAPLSQGKEGALAELETILRQSIVLEPTEDELRLAADIEAAASQAGFELDTGESQLAVIVATRSLNAFQTGDKRGIRGLDSLLDEVPRLKYLEGKVWCLEQIVQRVLTDEVLAVMTASVCAEPEVDKALSNCFACRSRRYPSRDEVLLGLASYIRDLRSSAPRVLVQ